MSTFHFGRAGLQLQSGCMVEIRACREDDYPVIANLLRQLWPASSIDDARLRRSYLAGLNSISNQFHCALEDGRIVGFCSILLKNSLWQQGLMAHVDELVVDKSVRGRGIGSRLLQNAVERAAAAGAARIELDSDFRRTEAHRFYEQQGFENRAYLFSKTLVPQQAAADSGARASS